MLNEAIKISDETFSLTQVFILFMAECICNSLAENLMGESQYGHLTMCIASIHIPVQQDQPSFCCRVSNKYVHTLFCKAWDRAMSLIKPDHVLPAYLLTVDLEILTAIEKVVNAKKISLQHK